MRFHHFCVATLSVASLILLSGCSSGGFAVEADEGAYPAAYSEWPGYYDPNYPYYWTLHDRDFDRRDFDRDHDRGDRFRHEGREGEFRDGGERHEHR